MKSTRNLGIILIVIGGLLSASSIAADRLVVFSGIILAGFVLLILSALQKRQFAGSDLANEMNRTYSLYVLIGRILRASVSSQRDLDAALASRFRSAIQSAPDRKMTFVEKSKVYAEVSNLVEFFSADELKKVFQALDDLENSVPLGDEILATLTYLKAELKPQ